MNKIAYQSNIHIIARGFLCQGNKVILCKSKGKDYFFLPGGHVENGESVKTALLRELREELGEASYNIISFIGVCENSFLLEDNQTQQEINIVFQVDVPESLHIQSQEDHLEFISIDQQDLEKYKILPAALKDGLLGWVEFKQSFFTSL